MTIEFSGKVCLVTGAGSGIGRATAYAFAKEGAKVIAVDINRAAGEETVSTIISRQAQAEYIQVDVSNPNDIEEMFREIASRHQTLDVAVNCAGISGAMMPFSQYPDEIWRKVLDVNLCGVWYCMKYEIAQFLKQGGGRIVNVASAAGLRGMPNHSAYTATKHAVLGLTKAVALENAKNDIRVNAVCPAFTDTPMLEEARQNPELFSHITNFQPMGRLGKPEEVANAILWLCSDKASFTSGHALTVDGGLMA